MWRDVGFYKMRLHPTVPFPFLTIYYLELCQNGKQEPHLSPSGSLVQSPLLLTTHAVWSPCQRNRRSRRTAGAPEQELSCAAYMPPLEPLRLADDQWRHFPFQLQH